MKIGGVEITVSEEVLVLPRSQADDIVIKARAVDIQEDFDKLVPPVEAPGVRTKNGFKPDTEDADYLTQVENRNSKWFDYLVLRSLVVNEIDWQTVNMDDPATWHNWDTELRAAGLSDVEVKRVSACVVEANALNEAKLEAARKDFLLGQGK